MNTSIL